LPRRPQAFHFTYGVEHLSLAEFVVVSLAAPCRLVRTQSERLIETVFSPVRRVAPHFFRHPFEDIRPFSSFLGFAGSLDR
jgi:hypothetical protein